MKKSVITDERIEMEKMKIISAAFGIMNLGIIIDLLYKLYINAPFSSLKGELIILLVTGAFYLCESTRKGLIELLPSNSSGEKRKLKIRYIIVNTLLAASYAAVDVLDGSVKTNTDKLGLGLGALAFIVLGLIIDIIIMKKSNKAANSEIDKEGFK